MSSPFRPRWLGGARRTGPQGCADSQLGRAQRHSRGWRDCNFDAQRELDAAQSIGQAGLLFVCLAVGVMVLAVGLTELFDWIGGVPR
jgi:hypothetical protein